MRKDILASVVFFVIYSCNGKSKFDFFISKSKPSISYLLKLNPKPGASYVYSIKSETTLKMKVDDKDVNKTNRISIDANYNFRIDSLEDLILQLKYNKIHIYTKNGDDESEVDAANANYSINALERMLGELRNAKLETDINSAGKVKSVRGYHELGVKLVSEMTGADENAKKMAQAQWDNLIGEQLIKKNIDDMFAFINDSSIRVGQTWKVKSRQTSEIPLNTVTEYKLKDMNSADATIVIDSEIKSDSGTIIYQGAKVSFDLKGKEEGQYQIDVKTGMPIHFEADSKVEGIMNVLGREVPIKLSKKIEILQIQN